MSSFSRHSYSRFWILLGSDGEGVALENVFLDLIISHLTYRIWIAWYSYCVLFSTLINKDMVFFEKLNTFSLTIYPRMEIRGQKSIFCKIRNWTITHYLISQILKYFDNFGITYMENLKKKTLSLKNYYAKTILLNSGSKYSEEFSNTYRFT